jgi:hypothetical protein
MHACRYYVEFGTESCEECTTRNLRQQGWTGLLMDGNNENPQINLKREFFTAESIAGLLEKYSVPKTFDHLTIDIDQNTFWVLHALLLAAYRPRVIVSEINRNFFPTDAFVVKYNASAMWDGTLYFGASVGAFERLFRAFGYHLLAADEDKINVYAVHSGEVGNDAIVSMDAIVAGARRIPWCVPIHPARDAEWLEVPEDTWLAQPREQWYDSLPRQRLACADRGGRRFMLPESLLTKAALGGGPRTLNSCTSADDISQHLST